MLFISHASNDAPIVERIVAFLEQRGIECWVSSRDISPQGVYAEAIAEGVRRCSACVVLLSAAANNSEGVKREVELASHHRKPFIAIRIDDSDLSTGLEYYLRNVQTSNFQRDGERSLERIVRHLTLARQSTEPQVVPPPPVSRSTASRPSGRDSGPRPGAIVGLAIAVGVSLIVILVSVFGNSRDPATYPPDYERNFMTACEAQGSTNALCACTWDRIEAEISPSDFSALERLPGPRREAHPLTAQINGYVEACHEGLATTPPAPAEEPVPAP